MTHITNFEIDSQLMEDEVPGVPQSTLVNRGLLKDRLNAQAVTLLYYLCIGSRHVGGC